MNDKETTKPKDCRPLPQQHKRSHRNNYHGRGIYMLTLCTEGRLPLLGNLIGESPETASVVPTPLGEAVLKCWEAIPSLQKAFAQKNSINRVEVIQTEKATSKSGSEQQGPGGNETQKETEEETEGESEEAPSEETESKAE